MNETIDFLREARNKLLDYIFSTVPSEETAEIDQMVEKLEKLIEKLNK